MRGYVVAFICAWATVGASQTSRPEPTPTAVQILHQMQEQAARIDDAENRTIAYADILFRYVSLGMVPQALAVVEGLDHEDQDELYSHLAFAVAVDGQLDLALDVLKRVGDEQHRYSPLRLVIRRMARTDPARATELASPLQGSFLDMAQRDIVHGLAGRGEYDEAMTLAGSIADPEESRNARLWVVTSRAIRNQAPLIDAAAEIGETADELPVRMVLDDYIQLRDEGTLRLYLPQIPELSSRASLRIKLAEMSLYAGREDDFEQDLAAALGALPELEGSGHLMQRVSIRLSAADLLTRAGRKSEAVSLLEDVLRDLGPAPKDAPGELASDFERAFARRFCFPAIVGSFMKAGAYDRAISLLAGDGDSVQPGLIAAAVWYLEREGRTEEAMRFRSRLAGPQGRLAILALQFDALTGDPDASPR